MKKDLTKKILWTVGFSILVGLAIYFLVLSLCDIFTKFDIYYRFYDYGIDDVTFLEIKNNYIIAIVRDFIFAVFMIASLIVFSLNIVRKWKKIK